jgi:hypothetical protein
VTVVSDIVPRTVLGPGGAPFRYSFAPASVTKLTITLA